MGEVTLRPDLFEIVEKDAEQEARSVNEIVNEAVEHYLRGRQQAKLDAEIAAYEQMHPHLRQTYMGQWVAIHEQELVDRDTDRKALYLRVRAKYGKSAILIRRVGEQPTQEVWFRTPSTGKITT